MQTTHFDDKVTIKCLKNGNMIEAEVLIILEKMSSYSSGTKDCKN